MEAAGIAESLDWVMESGSITSAQASVGAAATWPTRGTALIAPEPIRHGAATTPQPLNAIAKATISR